MLWLALEEWTTYITCTIIDQYFRMNSANGTDSNPMPFAGVNNLHKLICFYIEFMVKPQPKFSNPDKAGDWTFRSF